MKLVIFYKTSQVTGPSTTPYKTGGLAANALHTVGVLRKMGVPADMQAVRNVAELRKFLEQDGDITHVVIEAVWVKVDELARLATEHPTVVFVVRAHSKIGFLQVEPEAIPIIRGIISLSMSVRNIHFSSNNEEFCQSLEDVYGPSLFLPNLYDLDESPPRQRSSDGPLRIASFGASRLLKLHPNAALAALQIARRLGRKLEFFINTDNTPGSESVRSTIKNLIADIPWARLVQVPWQDSAEFKSTIASMDLVCQLSCTETFCLVAADAVASGVPVVVGPAITWAPENFRVEIDDTSHATTIGMHAILNDESVVFHQRRALEEFVKVSKEVWSKFLQLTPKHEKRHRRMWLF
jgi:hypothetical protein